MHLLGTKETDPYGARPFGSGRTDKGVHAEQQYFHVDVSLELDRVDLQYKLNKLLPDDISVRKIFQVPDGSHARFDAVERRYGLLQL